MERNTTDLLNSYTRGNSMKKRLFGIVLMTVLCLLCSCHREKEMPEAVADNVVEEADMASPSTKSMLPGGHNDESRYNHLVTLTNFTVYESGKFSLLMTKEMARELNISEGEYESYLAQLQTM